MGREINIKRLSPELTKLIRQIDYRWYNEVNSNKITVDISSFEKPSLTNEVIAWHNDVIYSPKHIELEVGGWVGFRPTSSYASQFIENHINVVFTAREIKNHLPSWFHYKEYIVVKENA